MGFRSDVCVWVCGCWCESQCIHPIQMISISISFWWQPCDKWLINSNFMLELTDQFQFNQWFSLSISHWINILSNPFYWYLLADKCTASVCVDTLKNDVLVKRFKFVFFLPEHILYNGRIFEKKIIYFLSITLCSKC